MLPLLDVRTHGFHSWVLVPTIQVILRDYDSDIVKLAVYVRWLKVSVGVVFLDVD